MRIGGGTVKGRRLFVPKGACVRPTSDRLKESLFSIIGDVETRSFLDLFAGTGNMGLEALSRGAGRVVFVEHDRILIEAINKNIAACGFGDCSEILGDDFVKAIRNLITKAACFDIIYADPPYEKGFVGLTLQELSGGQLLANDGLAVIQHSIREAALIDKSCRMALADQRRYADTLLSFFKKND